MTVLERECMQSKGTLDAWNSCIQCWSYELVWYGRCGLSFYSMEPLPKHLFLANQIHDLDVCHRMHVIERVFSYWAGT